MSSGAFFAADFFDGAASSGVDLLRCSACRRRGGRSACRLGLWPSGSTSLPTASPAKSWLPREVRASTVVGRFLVGTAALILSAALGAAAGRGWTPLVLCF